MSESVTLEIPDELVVSARAWAAAANRSLEDTLLEWIRSAMKEPPVDTLSKESLLALCDLELDALHQSELSDFLHQQREGLLSTEDRARMDFVLAEYRRGLVLKARALKEAVDRGLRPALDENGS
jgi:hypothetical protein